MNALENKGKNEDAWRGRQTLDLRMHTESSRPALTHLQPILPSRVSDHGFNATSPSLGKMSPWPQGLRWAAISGHRQGGLGLAACPPGASQAPRLLCPRPDRGPASGLPSPPGKPCVLLGEQPLSMVKRPNSWCSNVCTAWSRATQEPSALPEPRHQPPLLPDSPLTVRTGLPFLFLFLPQLASY